jgi:chorismate dehydratase
MIRLGHIDYSNCIPVHGPLLDAPPPGIEIVQGVPAFLNAELAAGRVDVAPCSSIEFARHADRYRVLPGLAIGAYGPVGSILLESTLPLEQLHRRVVAVPTASATSVVLLRILLERRLGPIARLRWFEQVHDADPIADGAAAALWIGDPALRRTFPSDRTIHDLGALWTDWTGLPFVFALWQTPLDASHDAELQRVLAALGDSVSAFPARREELAARYGARYGIESDRLLGYWRSLRYTLNPTMLGGLHRFYSFAAELGEAPPVTAVRFVEAAAPAAADGNAARAAGG